MCINFLVYYPEVQAEADRGAVCLEPKSQVKVLGAASTEQEAAGSSKSCGTAGPDGGFGSGPPMPPAWVVSHGVMMMLAWCFLIPFGAHAPRNLKAYFGAPRWFYVHRGLQVGGLVVAVAATAISIASTPAEAHFALSNVPHKALGLLVMIIAVLQPLNALCRGHPPEDGEKPTARRTVWQVWHRSLGWVGVILGGVNCALGAAATDAMGYAAGWAWIIFAMANALYLLPVLFIVFLAGGSSYHNEVPRTTATREAAGVHEMTKLNGESTGPTESVQTASVGP